MLTIEVDQRHRVSGHLRRPSHAVACLVLAHGAGAGMDHPFMVGVAGGLFARQIASLRFQFPFIEQGSKRPDRPALAQATVRAAVATAAQLAPDLPLFAGGKSFGGRMTSQAQAEAPLAGVRGLVFLGFPLHPPKTPSTQRAEHLRSVAVPMLFLQGTRDALADLALLRPVTEGIGATATLAIFEGADHSFHVPVRSGRTDAQILDALCDTIESWVARMQ